MSRITSRISYDWPGPEDKHGVENAEEKNHIDFTPLDHRWPLFFKSWITYSTYYLQNMAKWKKSHRKKFFFFNFLSSCHRIPVVVVIDRAYENARRGWTFFHCHFLKTKSVTPIFSFSFWLSTLWTNSRGEMKKISP